MKIECPSCAAKYSIGDDKVQDRLAKIRCRKCGTTIVIDGKQHPPNIYAADAGADSVAGAVAGPGSVGSAAQSSVEQSRMNSPASAEFTVDFGDGDQRNMSLPQVVEAYNRGEVTAEHYVWADGFDDWRALGEVDQIVEALHQSAAGASTGSAALAGAGSMQAAAAPRAAVGGRGTTDLFGRIDQAGSEEEVTTSAASADPMPSAPAATGARNESSVLFSLSALTSAANSRPSQGGLGGLATSSSSSTTKEDSGLIDLKALTAAAAASDESKPAPQPMGLGLTPAPLGGVASPLGMAPPLGGVSAGSPAMAFDPGPMPQAKNRTGLFIAGGIVVAAVAVALIVVSSQESPAPIPSAIPVAAPIPTPTPTPTPTPPESTAQAPATGAAEEDAGPPEEEKKKTTTVARRTWRPKKQTSTASDTPKSSQGSAPAAKAKPKKTSTSKCGCAPGDLQCAMRCAAGG